MRASLGRTRTRVEHSRWHRVAECFPWANRDASILIQAAKRGAQNWGGNGDRRVRGGRGRVICRAGHIADGGLTPQGGRAAPAPLSPRFTEPNRSPCTKMTISCEGIVDDSSNAIRLWIISPRFLLSCDIFGTGEAIYRPTSPFLHNLSLILYRHSGRHRKHPREGGGCLFSWLVPGGPSHPTSSPLASRALSSDPCLISIRESPCSSGTSIRSLSRLNQAGRRGARKTGAGMGAVVRGNGGSRAREGGASGRAWDGVGRSWGPPRAQPRDAKRPGRVGFNRPAPRAFALILEKSFAEVWGHAAEAAYGRWPMPPSSVMVSPLMNLKSGPQS